jgi:hypothetical protein
LSFQRLVEHHAHHADRKRLLGVSEVAVYFILYQSIIKLLALSKGVYDLLLTPYKACGEVVTFIEGG